MRRGTRAGAAAIAAALLGVPWVGASCGGADPRAEPLGVVEGLVTAARAADATALAELCAPGGHHDSDARRICAASPDDPDEWRLITSWFARAHPLGAPRTRGDLAEVDLAFGPEAERRAVAHLVRVGGRWYLSSL